MLTTKNLIHIFPTKSGDWKFKFSDLEKLLIFVYNARLAVTLLDFLRFLQQVILDITHVEKQHIKIIDSW